MNGSMWKYERIYKQMLLDERFDPVVVVAPRINQSKLLLQHDQDEVKRLTDTQGIPVVFGYSQSTDKWLRLRDFKPDIIFYTQPYDGMLPASYEYWSNLSSLICYVPYSFQISEAAWNWDNGVQNFAWRNYLSLPHHQLICRKYSRAKAKNAIPVGYFFEEEYDEVIRDKTTLNNIWGNDNRKRVIWAPHHSLNDDAPYRTSTFLELCEYMLEIRDQHVDDLIICFKPHPMLLNVLCEIWGYDKANSYYQKWACGSNSFYYDGDFIPLFAGSDAMIHCSSSFIVDYIYTGKPVQYVYCKNWHIPPVAQVIKASLDAHYHARKRSDIEAFLDKVVIGGKDTKLFERKNVYNDFLKMPNCKLFSENVVEDIIQNLK